MKDVNDLMQAILEMDAAQRRESEKARLGAGQEQRLPRISSCNTIWRSGRLRRPFWSSSTTSP